MVEGLKEKVSNDHEGGGNLFFSITRLMPQVRFIKLLFNS